MKVASLFAGVGGFDLALTRLGHEIVYVNEWDKYAAQTYEKNFCGSPDGNPNGGKQKDQTGNDEAGEGLESSEGKGTEIEKRQYEQHNNGRSNKGAIHYVDTRSITDVSTGDIPDHDLLVGGFPCQAFSIAGKRGGFNDTRGTLFFEIARILKDKRPAYLLLENVKGLLSHDNGRTFETIMRTLDELGYECQWQVLNSKNFGVPQNRERVFIVGNRRGTRRPNVFPLTTDGYGGDIVRKMTWGSHNRVAYDTTGISPTVTSASDPKTTKSHNGYQVPKIMVQCENGQTTINEKVYQMSESVSENARTFLLGMAQSKAEKLSVSKMQDLFTQIEQGIQRGECSEIEREPQEVRQQSKGYIQEVETLGAYLGSEDDTGAVYSVVRIPTEDMLLLWSKGGGTFQRVGQIQQQDKADDDRQDRQQETLRRWELSSLLFAVQPYQGRLFYSIGDGRDWVNIYQTKVETTCKENNLSSILEDNPDPKYFLSEKMTDYLMERMNQTKDGHKPKLVTPLGEAI